MNDLWNKPVNELTVGDSLKLQLQITAVVAAFGVVVFGGATLVEKTKTWKKNRKAKQTLVEN